MKVTLKKPVAQPTTTTKIEAGAVVESVQGDRLSVGSSLKLTRKRNDVFESVEEQVSLTVTTTKATLLIDRAIARKKVQEFLWEHMNESLGKLNDLANAT